MGRARPVHPCGFKNMSERLRAVKMYGRGIKPGCSSLGSQQDEEIEFGRNGVTVGLGSNNVSLGTETNIGPGSSAGASFGIGASGFTSVGISVGPFKIETVKDGCDIVTIKSIAGQVVQREYQTDSSPECEISKQIDPPLGSDGRSRAIINEESFEDEDNDYFDKKYNRCQGKFITVTLYHFGYVLRSGKSSRHHLGFTIENAEKIPGRGHGHFLEYFYPVYAPNNPYYVNYIALKENPPDTFLAGLASPYSYYFDLSSGFSNLPGGYSRSKLPSPEFVFKQTNSEVVYSGLMPMQQGSGLGPKWGRTSKGMTAGGVRSQMRMLMYNAGWYDSTYYDFIIIPKFPGGLCGIDYRPTSNEPPRHLPSSLPRKLTMDCCKKLKKKLNQISNELKELKDVIGTNKNEDEESVSLYPLRIEKKENGEIVEKFVYNVVELVLEAGDLAIFELLTKISNSTGIAEEPGYPYEMIIPHGKEQKDKKIILNNIQETMATFNNLFLDIYKAVHPQLFLEEKGIEIEKGLISPKSSGKVFLQNYPDLVSFIIRMLAMTTVLPFTAEIEDSNLALEGNQKMTSTYSSATAATKGIAEELMRLSARTDAILGIALKNAVQDIRNTRTIVWNQLTLEQIATFLGYRRNPKVKRIPLEFDPSLGIRKSVGGVGFSASGGVKKVTNKKFDKEIQKLSKKLENSDADEINKMLWRFLEPSEVPVQYEDFDDEGNAPTLEDLLFGGE